MPPPAAHPRPRSREIDATTLCSPSLPFAGDQCRRPPQAHPETLIFPWDCWWHMKVWVGAQLLSPLLNSAPKCLRSPSAPKCLRSPSAPKCPCCPSAPKCLHFPGAPWNAISTIIFFGGGNPPWSTVSPDPPWPPPSPQNRHGRPSSLLRHGLPSSLLQRWSRNGRCPGGHLSCLHVPWGLQSAHPPSPLDVVRRGTRLLGGGSNVRPVSPCLVSPCLLYPYMVLPISCSVSPSCVFWFCPRCV